MSKIIHDHIDLLTTRVKNFIDLNIVSWNEGMKPKLLQSKQFLDGYKQPKHWVMYKPIKSSQNQVEAVNVKVSNSSFQQLSEPSKRLLPCELEYHNAVKIQTFEEFKQLQKAKLALVTEIKQANKQIKDEATHTKLTQALINLQAEYFGLLFEWKVPQSTCRIVVLSKGQQFKDLNYFIYHDQETEASLKLSDKRVPLTVKATNPLRLQFMKQIIKIHHMKRKNQAILQKLQQKFKSSIDKSFAKAFNDHKQRIEVQKKKLYSNSFLAQSFRSYEFKHSKQFIEQWKDGVKSIKESLLLQVFSIWINKSNIPVSVKLNINGQTRHYDYKYYDNQYLVYLISEKNAQKFYRINIQDARFLKKICIQVEIKLKNSEIVKYSQDHYVYLFDKRESLFTQQLVLQMQNNLNFNSVGGLINNQSYCLVYLNQIFSRTQNLGSLVHFYESGVFKNVGKIPSKYSESYSIDYTPQTFKTIRALMKNQTYPSKLSKLSFQRAYFQLVKFSQKQENQSQRTILFLPLNKRNNKFLMKQRYQTYNKKLLQGIGFFSKGEDFDYFFKKNYEEFSNNILQQKNIALPKTQYKNFLEDLKNYSPRNSQFVKNQIIKFIYFAVKVPKMQQFPYKLRYTSHIIPIFQCLFELYMQSKQNDMGSSSMRRLQSYSNYLFTFIAFFAKLYPYAELDNLKSDLYILRWLVQKKLPNFNDYLNRSNIGLQNFVSQILLHFFTGLASQLTYRIWDLLISTQKRDQARIIVAFTLLTFYQASDALPIIPINQFMERVQTNIKTISTDKQFAAKFSKIAHTYFSSENTKQQRLIKHIKSGGDNSIIEDRILKKIILGESKLKIPYQQQGKIPISRAKQFQKENLTIKQLRYPLPQPNYLGLTIIQVVLFIHDLHILQNLNLNINKYWLKFYIPKTQWKDYTQIIQKSYFYNKSIRIPSEHINFFNIAQKDKKASIQRHIKVDIVTNVDLINHDQSKEKVQLAGFIDYGTFQKDNAYKTFINLTPKDLHNKGRTILNLAICLKSHLYDRSLIAKQKFSPLQLLSQKLLDYDIGQSNQCITAINKLSSRLQKIKFPLDQFSSDQYKRVTNRALSQYEPDWFQSSLTSIEQLKAIFYNLFSQQKDKSIKHQFTKFYQIFAEEHNMQFVLFAEMLVKFILLSRITRKKKLMYLYCVAVHYQNCYSKRVNIETVNSLIRLIFKQNTLINACPYVQGACGKIIEAYYFQSDLKSQQKKDFTDIVQDWSYICNFKYGYSDIILGSSHDLPILRSFFDVKTLKKMEQQKQCRFEIVYEVEGFRYIWSATVDPKTFEIIKRGTKFLNQFTGYANIKYLDSTQQFLLNCQNIIPLQNHRSYSYEQFTKVMLQNDLIRYILDLPFCSQLSKKRQEEQIINLQPKANDQQQNNEDKSNEDKFNSWAICRGQNCLENWHRCQITKAGKIMSKVIFQFDKHNECNVATLDLIGMQEIDLHAQKK